MTPEQAFEEWWKKHLYRGDLHLMAQEAWQAATERAAVIAEKEPGETILSYNCSCPKRIAQKIRMLPLGYWRCTPTGAWGKE